MGILEETNTYWWMICVLRTGLRREGCGMSGLGFYFLSPASYHY